MATKEKDPCVLWYWNDWITGTMRFTRHLKGCYMDLLGAQFNGGHLSLDEIKTVLGNDFAVWGVLSKKFVQDENGLYYNEKAKKVKENRESFSKKQSERANKKNNAETGAELYAGFKPDAMPFIENENRNEIYFKIKRVIIKNTISEFFKKNFSAYEPYCIKYGKEKVTKVLSEMDIDNIGYEFRDNNHFQNAIKFNIEKNGKFTTNTKNERNSSVKELGNLADQILEGL